MAEEGKKGEGAEVEGGRENEGSGGKVKRGDRARAPSHKATKRKASLLFDYRVTPSLDGRKEGRMGGEGGRVF